MNIITNIKRMFLGGGSATTIHKDETATLPILRRMQAVCAALPDGQVFVKMDDGELNICLKWNASAGHGLAHQLFSLDGTGLVTLYNGTEADKSATSDTQAYGKECIKRDDACSSLSQRLGRFLMTHYAFRYNTLTEQTECAELTDDAHLIYVPADKRRKNGICLRAHDEGIRCWNRDVDRYLDSDRIEEYHPFHLYFDSLPKWDGKDRVTELAHRVDDGVVWTNAFHRWMLGMVAQWTGKGDGRHANSVAPILISAKQGWDKSTFCRMLMPTELSRYFTDSYGLNAQSSAEQKLATFGLINIDEFDRLSPNRMPLLKNLMQMESLNIRKAYKHNAEPLARLASFIGTSNRRDLLTDGTGSRRFICVELKHPIDCSPIDCAQLYAQLKNELERGGRYWLTKCEEADVQRNNKAFQRVSPAEEVFHSMFHMTDKNDDGARLMTASEIFKEMKRRNGAAMRGVDCNALSRLLPTFGERVHTEYCNGYYVKLANGN